MKPSDVFHNFSLEYKKHKIYRVGHLQFVPYVQPILLSLTSAKKMLLPFFKVFSGVEKSAKSGQSRPGVYYFSTDLN